MSRGPPSWEFPDLRPKDYWNSVAGAKEFTLPLPVEELKEHVAPAARVLDVGCGYGRAIEALRDEGYGHLYGVDIADRMVVLARKRVPEATFEVMPDSPLPCDDGFFDAILIIGVLTCIIADEDQQRLVREAARALKPRGLLCIADFLLNTDERNLERYQAFEPAYGTYGVFELPEGAPVRHHREKWIRELLGEFEELSFERRTARTMNGHTSNSFLYLGRST